MRFFVLGPIHVRVGGAVPSLAAPTLRVLLGCLLARPNAPVSFDEVIDALWGDKPVPNARQRLHVHVHRLRRLLGDPSRIACQNATYRLCLQPGELDAETFESMLDQAGALTRAGHHDRAAATIREALGLWEGPAYVGLDHVPALRAEAERLTERRLVAFEDLCAAEVANDRGGAMIAEMRDLAAQYPLRERLQEQLMIALYRAGQQASALEVYRRTRTALVDELGVEPSPRLAELHASVLAADPSLGETPASTAQPGPFTIEPTIRTTIPAQLPAAIADFTGRDKQLALIQDLAGQDAGPADADAGVTPVLAISGPAGIGKTALAICAAHRLRAAYPDGQLYVDLRGAEAVSPDAGDVLARFVRALGTAAEAIPERPEERATLFRSLVADSRLLVLLDNASSEEQVRQLIPAARGCLVLITSRTPLGGLEGSRLIDLERFDREQALELLARVTGRERVAAEPEAAARIVELCGLLPLAVRIAAARLAIRPDWAFSRLAARLADERRRLDELQLGDLAVRASLASSEQDLQPVAQKAFRRLGLLDAPQLPAWLASSVLGEPAWDSEPILDQLVDAQLLELVQVEGAPRYRLHDLVRLYARERAEEADAAGVIERAGDTALALTTAALHRLQLGPSRPTQTREQRYDVPPPDPLDWLETERTVLVSIVDQLAAAGLAAEAGELALALTPYLDSRAHYDDWRRTHEAALGAARRFGHHRSVGWMSLRLAELARIHDDFGGSLALLDQASKAFLSTTDEYGDVEVRLQTGMTYRALGRPYCALSKFGEVRRRFDQLHDDHGVALAELNIGAAYLDLQRQGDAREHLMEALTAFRAHGDRRNLALALRWLGVCDRYDGHYLDSESRLTESRATFEALGDSHNAAFVLGDLGRLCLALGRCVDARKLFEESLAGFRTYRDRHGEARALHDIGIVQQRRARHHLAARYLRDAVGIWRELGVRLWHERSLRSLRVSLLATGDMSGARSAAERADSLADEVGAQRPLIRL
ncbi:BTAD domain-containing putative transcriptional regulator [Kribbella sp. NPDC002412]